MSQFLPETCRRVPRKAVKIALIIATVGRSAELARLLKSLAAQTLPPAAVFVGDQNPQGFLEPVLAEFRQDLPLCVTPLSNCGVSAARNRLLQECLKGGFDWIGFPDDDCWYEPGTLEHLVAFAASHADAGGVLASRCRPEGEGYSVPDRPLNRFTAFHGSETYLQFYHAEVVRCVGLFDERLGPGNGLSYGCGEDTDYLLRALAAGVPVLRAKEVMVCHPVPLLEEGRISRKWRLYGQGRMALLRKHSFPLWFVFANAAYPLVKGLLEGPRFWPYRWEMFRGRWMGMWDKLQSWEWRPRESPKNLTGQGREVVSAQSPATSVHAGTCIENGKPDGKMVMTDSPALRRLIEKFVTQYVSAMDRALLDFVFDDAPTQEKLDSCLAACDIEVLGAGKAILLTYVAHEHPELRFSAYAGPRTRGLNTYFRFANMKTLAHFARIGRAYNAAGIPLLLFKGGAMKVLRPTLSRPMGDVDILIPAERIAEATLIGERLGYEDKKLSRHAVDFHTETESAVDVHHALFDPAPGLDQDSLIKNLFNRASPCRAFGVDFLLPCHEDLCFLALNNLTKNLREHTTLHGLWFALCDCRWLQRDKADFDWRIVREDAALCGRELETRFAAEFMNRLVPGLIPDPGRHLPAGTAVDNFCEQVVYDESYFLPFQRRCQELRVVELKNAPLRWVPYLAKYFVMEKLRTWPAFVRWFLRRKERREAPHVL